MQNKTWLTSLGLAACLLGAASCSSGDGDNTDGAEATQAASAAPGSDDSSGTAGADGGAAGEGADSAAGTAGPGGEAAAPDLSDVPDVVAEVNDTEISKDEFSEAYTGSFEQASMQAEMTGQPVDEAALRKQTVEGLISNELLLQASDDHGFKASAKDIEAELEELAAGNGLGSGEEFVAALEEQGMTAEEVDAEVEKKIKVDQLVAEEVTVDKPTEKELKALYEELSAQQGGGGTESGSSGGGDEAGATGAPGSQIPAYEDVKDQLEAQLKSEKENEAVLKLVEELRADADVTVHL